MFRSDGFCYLLKCTYLMLNIQPNVCQSQKISDQLFNGTHGTDCCPDAKCIHDALTSGINCEFTFLVILHVITL